MAVAFPSVAVGRLISAAGAIGAPITTAGGEDRVVVLGTSQSGSGTPLGWLDGMPLPLVHSASTGRRTFGFEYRGPRATLAGQRNLTVYDPSATRVYVGGFGLTDSQDSPCTVVDDDGSAVSSTALATSVTVPTDGGLCGVACTSANGTVVTASGATAAAAVQTAGLSSAHGYEATPAGGAQACDWTVASGSRSCVTLAFGPRSQSLASLAPAVDATGVSPTIGTLTATLAAAAGLGSAGNVRVYETVAPSVAPSIVATSNGVSTGTASIVVRVPGQAAAWSALAVVLTDDRVRNGDRIYICTSPGTTAASGGPTGTGSGISDGTATWAYESEALLSGDIATIFLARKNVNVFIPPAGWNAIDELGGITAAVFWRRCDGSEPSTLNLTLSAANDVACHGWLIRGAHETDAPYFRVVGYTSGTTSFDPPNVVLPGTHAAEPCLVLAYAAVDNNTTISGFPAGYSNTGTTITTNGTAAQRVAQGYADTTGTASSFDPGTFTAGASRTGLAITCVLRPADPSTLVETIPYSDCTVSGDDLLIPVGTLSASTAHHVQLDDQVAVGWYGYDSSQREWRFTTGAGSSSNYGVATETDAAVALVGSVLAPYGVSTETGAAVALVGSDLAAYGVATETDSAVALVQDSGAAYGIAEETDAAVALVGSDHAAYGVANETDSAVALVGSVSVAYGVATETDAAVVLVGSARSAYGVALEFDEAVALEMVTSHSVAPAERTFYDGPLLTTFADGPALTTFAD